jgi:hypothetical protein
VALSLNPSGGLAGYYPEGIRWEVTGVPTWTFLSADLQSRVTASARREGNTVLPHFTRLPCVELRITRKMTKSKSKSKIFYHVFTFLSFRLIIFYFLSPDL